MVNGDLRTLKTQKKWILIIVFQVLTFFMVQIELEHYSTKI